MIESVLARFGATRAEPFVGIVGLLVWVVLFWAIVTDQDSVVVVSAAAVTFVLFGGWQIMVRLRLWREDSSTDRITDGTGYG